MNNTVLFRKTIYSPCKGCEDRYAECHAHCEKWAEYEEKRNEMYKERRTEAEREQIMYDIEMKRIDTYRKQRGRKRR